MTKKFTVQVVIEAKNKAAAAFNSFKNGFEGALRIPTSLNQAMDLMGNTLGSVVNQIPQLVSEMAQLGIASEGATRRFTQFAGSSDRAASLLDAFNVATDGTVDKISAMTSAGRLLQMGLVANETEMGNVAEIATKLGDQTAGASARISDFSLLLANQSIPRLDNFGISSGKVRKRIKELQAATKDLSREEAFKIAVMEEGRKSLEILGDTSDLASVKIDKLKAAVQDAKIGMGELIVAQADAAGGFDKLGASIRNIPVKLKELSVETKAGASHYRAYNENLQKTENALRHTEKALQDSSDAITETNDKLRESIRTTSEDVTAKKALIEVTRQERSEVEFFALANDTMQRSVNKSVDSFNQYESAIAEAEKAQTKATIESINLREELEAQERAAISAAEANLGLALSFTDFTRRQEEETQSLVDKREQLEEKHQKNLEDIQKRGQSRTIQINAQAEEEKLAKLQQNLEIALLQQEEFTGKTKESTLLRKDIQIATLQEGIASQTQLLSDFHAGRLVQAGQNVDGLLAEEQRQHDESIALLEDQMAQQEEAQRQALGRMVLQSFDAWAQMKGVAADRALEMRTALASEFDLIDEDAANVVNRLTSSWEDWAEDTKATTRGVIIGMRSFTDDLGKDTTPSIEKVGEKGKRASESIDLLSDGFQRSTEQIMAFDAEMERGNELLDFSIEKESIHNEQIETSTGLTKSSTVAVIDRTKALDNIVSSTANLVEETELLSTKMESLNVWLDELPEEKTIKIKVDIEQSGGIPASGGGVSGLPEFQHGGSFRGMGIVGEGGQPELVFAPGGATVTPMRQNTTNNNFNMTVNTGQQSGAVVDEFEVMQALAQ